MGSRRGPWPLVWAVLQLGWWPGWLLDSPDRPWSPLTFSPAQLTVQEGENATFTCSLADIPDSFVLNWYRLSPRNQTDKLAAFQEDRIEPGRDRRFRVTRLPNGRDFHMSIVAARLNDSGIYLCGAIYLPPNTQINESPRAELSVTERTLEPPTQSPSPPPRLSGQLQGLVIGVTSVLVGVLLLLLLTWVLAAVFPRATREGGPRCSARLHPGLRGAGLPVAREDAGAPGALCPGADRVCHHRLPGQAGVPGPQGLGQQPAGSPASEPRGRTRPVAPLTGRLRWPMSCRLSTRSPAGTSPEAASSGGPGGCSGAEPVTPAACGSPHGSPLSTHDLGAAGAPVPAPVPLRGCAWGKEARPGPQARPPEPDGPPRPDCCPVLPHVPPWGRGPVPRPPGCLHVGTQGHWPETPLGTAC
uniref:Programmed cell death 1 n=2 Tax=Canis lupus familiaris TaxID=9615 RepID=A0A8I3PR61_CANLF